MNPILSVDNLVTSFRQGGTWIPVVRDVSFEVGAGETVAIVGESGSGKSVTSLSIMRLLPAYSSRTEGSIRLGETELLSLPEKRMQRIRGNEIAMVFQEPMTSLNPVLTVGRQIMEALRRHRDLSKTAAAAETVRLLDRVRIPSAAARFDEHPHQLSGGMLQRVMIAMALACRPKLLITDEPTTALDVTIQAQILDLLKELQQDEDMAILFITHDMGVVAEISDRTVVMYRGEAVETGTTADIFAAPRAPYTRALLAAVPQLGLMATAARPMRFPSIDMATGRTAAPAETPDTVATEGPPALEVENLTTRFDIRAGLLGGLTGRVHAVENVSFAVRAGETLALVGESGCGKSTTGRSILRLVKPTGGAIRVEGRDVLALDRRELRYLRQRMQMIFQDPFSSLNPRARVADAIAEPLISNRICGRTEARDRTATLLERVGLSAGMGERYPHELSGGQRQRVCIARVLGLNPILVVADEAVSALDVSIKAQVVNLMLDLQASLGLGYLFISHDMAVVERVAHRVAVMYLGEIVEIGSRASIFGSPRHPYTRKLLEAVPVPDPARRVGRRPIAIDEIKTPIRPPRFVPPNRPYFEAAPGHLVQAWD